MSGAAWFIHDIYPNSTKLFRALQISPQLYVSSSFDFFDILILILNKNG